jgi:ABC-2 type transport system ATP-binding protein
MKADIAASLLHNPAVLFLDEPTVGVDVVTKARLRTFLLELNRTEQTTILLTTHDMQDIEALCQRVVVIDHGRIIHDGDLDSLKSRYGARKRLVFTLTQPIEVKQRDDLALPGVTWEQSSPLQVVATLAADADNGQILQKLLSSLSVADVRIEEPMIEQVVQELYGEHSSAKALAGAGHQ